MQQAKHAQSIKSGMKVIVRDDDGNNVAAVADGDPWLLGGHTYVVNCDAELSEKRFRAFNVMRVRPA